MLARSRPTGRESGLSLVEVLVSVTILAVAATIALVLYDGARQSFKLGENVAEQQQAVRIAFDLIAADIRMAGFNTNPDGNKVRPDEEIEAAYDTAIVVRADFDASDPVESLDPEQSLSGPGSAFLSVSTGNDEIRAYVLAKPGGSSPDTLTFQADVGQTVRDGLVETVDIDDINLTHDDPPYTLYRISLDENADPVRTVLIENVRSLRFRYYDGAGNLLPAVGGMDDDAALRARDSIRRIGVEIEALTRDPDLRWVDANDSNPATRAFRKFSLVGDIAPRNLGMLGIKDSMADTAPPSAPAAPALYTGHCGGLNISWPPNPPEDEAAYYRVLFGTSPTSLTGQRLADGLHHYLGGLYDGTDYYVALQAMDASGNQSEPSPLSSIRTENTNRPEEPAGIIASVNANNRIELHWGAVVENEAATHGDPRSPLLRELAGYRVYRSSNCVFDCTPPRRIADESSVENLPDPSFTDGLTVACRSYYYRVTAVDRCGLESEPSALVAESVFTSIAPAAPIDVQAFHHWLLSKKLQWSAVRKDVNGNPIAIDEYLVFRTAPISKKRSPRVPEDFSLVSHVREATEYTDNVTVPAGMVVWYVVQAIDDCVNESEYSEPVSPRCSFSGRTIIRNPVYGESIWGPTDLIVAVEDGASSYQELRLNISSADTGASASYTLAGPGPVWTLNWDAHPDSGFPQGRYLIRVEVDQSIFSSTCTSVTSTEVDIHP
jgi:prepilin-type N-terminal cleavage/methylation domain-containing protein